MIKRKKSSIDDLATSIHDLSNMVDGQFKEVKKKIDGVEERLSQKIGGVEDKLSDQIEKLSRSHDKTLDQTQQNTVRITKLEKQIV